MDKMLEQIVRNNPRLDLKKVIIIANVEPDIIEIFHQQYPAFQAVTILRGEHYNETLLEKANVRGAAEVFILADESNAGASVTEMDSKTIMTAMTVRNISRDVRITAELMDVKFEGYLKAAHVEDIIYTREYSKVLVANSFDQVGITKVFNHLLSVSTNNFIVSERVPEPFVGKPFSGLRDYYRKECHAVCFGLIENVGSYFDRKQEALREAQKTADVNRLIDNLKQVKRLENNRPNLNPGDDYTVPMNSNAVLIVTRNV
jgi:voltage-gated potassium channel